MMETFLKATYYDPGHVAGFSSVAKLVKAAKEAGYQATRGNVEKWLRKQHTYGLTKPIRKSFKRSTVVVEGFDAQWEADLIDMSPLAKSNDQKKFVLVVEDAFSRFCWTRTLKSKTASEVAKALEDIFSEGRKPRYSFRTDKGREFLGVPVQTLLKNHYISHYKAQNETKAGLVERLIKSLKSRLYKYMLAKQTHNWSDVIRDITNSYNHSVHRSLGRSPASVNAENANKVEFEQYLIKNKISLEPKKNPSKKKRKPRPLKPKYKKGDKVRLSSITTKFSREYHEKWTWELFKVKSIFKRQGRFLYKLEDMLGEDITGSFYKEELSKADEPDGGLFIMDKVIKKRGRGNKAQGLIRWYGWPKKFDTWEPLNTIKEAQVTIS